MKRGGGTSLAHERRARDPMFTERVFVGSAIDIGAGPDPLRMCAEFPRLTRVREWDQADGDATYMRDVPNEQLDLVYSSHCLEHIADDVLAIGRWWELVKVGGHLVLVVPDVRTYERDVWPSVRNGDHKRPYNEAGVLQLVMRSLPRARLVRFETLDVGFEPGADRGDQTADGTCECGLEIIVRKEAA